MSLLIPDIAFDRLIDGFYLEALLIEGDDIWFTDVTRGGVRKLGSDQVLLPDRAMIGGLLLDESGALLVGGEGGIAWVDPESRRSGMLLDGVPGVNEMRSDGQGGLYFGTIDLPAIMSGRPPGPSAIWHLSRDHGLKVVWENLAFANGLAVSADGIELYFNESFRETKAFPIAPDGSLGAPRRLAEIQDCDGLALDVDGGIWITGFSSPELRCFSRGGDELHRIALPGKACTNVRFGGADLRDLYVTIVDPASAQALAEGRPLKSRNSAIYKARSPIAGAPIARTALL